MLKKINFNLSNNRHLKAVRSLKFVDTSEKSVNDFKISQYELYEFFSFLNSKLSSGLKKESDSDKLLLINYSNNSENNFYDLNIIQIPVTFIQILIIILVFFLFLFLCKFNQLMEILKNKIETKRNNLDDVYSYRNTCLEYCRSFWFNFRTRRRMYKRRNRHKQRTKQCLSNRDFDYRKKSSKSNKESFYRTDSVVFKRRSVIFRNKKKRITNSFDRLSSQKSSRLIKNNDLLGTNNNNFSTNITDIQILD